MIELRPASEVMGDCEIRALPEGCIPLEAVVLVKALDEEGVIGWYTRYTDSLLSVEVLGALRAATLLEERSMLALYEPDDDA